MKELKKITVFLFLPFFLIAQYTGGSGDGFAVWTSQEDISLPVELLSYRYFAAQESIMLEWETASEIENLGFIVKRKKLPENSFQIIDSYRSNSELRGMGTSSFGRRYAFADFGVSPGNEYIYQVVSVDYSGTQKIQIQTDIITFSEGLGLPSEFTLNQNYPNPFNPSTTISFKLEKTKRVKISVYTINGELVKILTNRSYNAGKYEIKFSPSGALSSNLYICRFESGSFVKYLKMTYLK